MTREAGDVLLAIGELTIDGAGELNHAPCNFLVVLLVAGEIAFNVAKLALDAQRDGVGPHDRYQALRRQQFQILRGRVLVVRRLSGLLSQ